MDRELIALAEGQASVCSVFANPKRILIAWTLAGRERSVSEIAAIVGTSLQSTSQHLRVMRERGILCARRDGQTIYYALAGNGAGGHCPLLVRRHPPSLQESTDS